MELFKKNFLDEAAELFDLPPDLVAGLPHIEVVGNTHFYMERHKGILSYSGEEIDINGEKGIVRVYGEHLELMSMTGDQLRIKGTISRVEWVK
ncbi:MAG: sporulation protein YqfC [Oscillospiraceae bacterium]|nr:sporulation protein YqfC [Oscillospiraceae bacterium]